MFSVYGVSGRIFNGTLEQWRQVARVSASARTHAIRPTTRELRGARAAVGERPAGGSAGELQRAAMAAYAQTQQGAAPRRATRCRVSTT